MEFQCQIPRFFLHSGLKFAPHFTLNAFSFQAKFECALRHPGIKIVTPDWITDTVKGIIFCSKDTADASLQTIICD